MNVRNCKMCGRIFNYFSGQPVCPACREALEKKFQEVKQFVETNIDTSVANVAKSCEVEEGQIRQWVREERLVFAEGAATGINCEVCGAPIRTGRFCDKCKNEMVNTFSNASKKTEMPKPQPRKDTRDNPKMRYLDNH